MVDLPSEVREALASLEAEQRERYAPKPQEPLTPAEAYAEQLDAARSKMISVDAGWLR